MKISIEGLGLTRITPDDGEANGRERNMKRNSG